MNLPIPLLSAVRPWCIPLSRPSRPSRPSLAQTLSRELPECRLFYNFLDEKYGEDETTFFLHALRIVDSAAMEVDGGLPWGEAEAGTYEIMNAQDREREEREGKDNIPPPPELCWLSMAAVKLAVQAVLTRATPEDREAINNRVGERSVSSEGRVAPRPKYAEALPVGVFDPPLLARCVEAGGVLRCLLQEYREEQAHRRAAVRLMFNTATAETAKGADADSDAGEASAAGDDARKGVDVQQFATIVQSLNSRAHPVATYSMYRDCWEEGNGIVDYASFLRIANKWQFFSDCLRLPRFIGAAFQGAPSYANKSPHEYNKRKRARHAAAAGGGRGEEKGGERKGTEGDDDDGDGGAGGAAGAEEKEGKGGEDAEDTEATRGAMTILTNRHLSQLTAVVHRHAKLFEGDVEHLLNKMDPALAAAVTHARDQFETEAMGKVRSGKRGERRGACFCRCVRVRCVCDAAAVSSIRTNPFVRFIVGHVLIHPSMCVFLSSSPLLPLLFPSSPPPLSP